MKQLLWLFKGQKTSEKLRVYWRKPAHDQVQVHRPNVLSFWNRLELTLCLGLWNRWPRLSLISGLTDSEFPLNPLSEMDLRKETKISCSLRNGGMLRQVASLLISCITTASPVFVLLAGIKQVHKNAEKSRKGINSTTKNNISNVLHCLVGMRVIFCALQQDISILVEVERDRREN